MKRRPRLGATLCALLLGALALTACAAPRASDPGCRVGVSMPTRALERWIRDGSQVRDGLVAAGCTVDLQYADARTDVQINQIQNQVAGGVNVVVVAPVDGAALAPALADAKAGGVTVIAYDRVVTGTNDVDYLATFDNYQVGRLQAQFIEKKLGLDRGKGPFNLEPFAGSPDTENARYFFAGGWDLLRRYVDDGRLRVPSGKAPATSADWASVGILNWDSATAQAEMDNRLSSFYPPGTKVDAVFSPNDSLALGIVQSLTAAGYRPGPDWPVITGQDGDKSGVRAILADEQAMTVFKDTRLLAERTVEMVKSVVARTPVEVNDTTTYATGTGKVIPTFTIQPVVVTKKDVRPVLIDSGYLRASDVGL